jgi:hypothetical protein
MDHEFAILPEETGLDPLERQAGVKISQYSFVCGLIHGKVMVRPLVEVIFPLMAFFA